ncbi:unnamed protein product, partial [Effrenium voratum]
RDNAGSDSQDQAWSDEWWGDWGWYSSREGSRGYGVEYPAKNHSEDLAWKTDAQTRRYSHCDLSSLVASQSGVWHGAAAPPGGHQAAEETPWDFNDRKDKPSERLNVPTFDGEAEDEKLGLGARSYLRKLQVWLRCTRLPPEQRALALYSALGGRAWSFAEELNLDRLATAEGVEYFQEWIRTRFLDLELTKVGRVMTEFFRKFKRRPEHTMRAALLQDRTLRRDRGQTAWMVEDVDESSLTPEVACELHTTFEAHLAAKAKFKATVAGRGVDQDEAKARAKQRLQEAKNRSYCSACKRKGHWRKDAICPLNKGGSRDKEPSNSRPGHECHVVFATAVDSDHIGTADGDMIQLNPELVFEAGGDTGQGGDERRGPNTGASRKLVAIMDTACSRTVAGYDWFQEYSQFAEANNLPLHTVDQSETFRFGASRPHQSRFAVWAVLGLERKNFLVKVSIVNCMG